MDFFRRRMRVRERIKRFNVRQKLRVCVHKSSRNIYCQVVDDSMHVTLAAASTLTGSMRGLSSMKNASKVGVELAQKTRKLGLWEFVLDRSGYRYCGKVKSLLDSFSLAVKDEAGIR